MTILVFLTAGLIFGLGLCVSGMADPAKVANFLDLAGAWDPSLAFVMGGALIVAVIGYRLAWRAKAPLLADRFSLPTQTAIDKPLILGAAIFGIGWGLGGICPGPALTILTLDGPDIWIFITAMGAGMAIARQLAFRPAAQAS